MTLKLNDPKTQQPQNWTIPKLDNPKLDNPKTRRPQNLTTPKLNPEKQGPKGGEQ